MRNFKITKLDPYCDESAKMGLERTFSWNKRWFQSFNGFPYDELISGHDGMSFTIYVPEGVEKERVNEALNIMFSQRDVVRYSVFSLPMSFFEEQGWSFE